MISRLRETAILEDISVGACLLERLKSRRSLRPAFRSRASLSSQPSAAVLFFLRSLTLLGGLARVAWAFARAPKEMVAAASGTSDSDSDSDSEDSD